MFVAFTKEDNIKLLMDEWKQNVSLYIDQDKRGFDRIKMFLTINAGMFVLYGILFSNFNNIVSMIAGLILSITAFYITDITWKMSIRAHQFILLRVRQGMFIENKIKKLINPKGKWSSDSGIITTFTREHITFLDENKITDEVPQFLPLKKEFDIFGEYAKNPFSNEGIWIEAIGHLSWLGLMHKTLKRVWIILGVAIILSSIFYNL